MPFAVRSVARFKPDTWNMLVPLFEQGETQERITRLTKISRPLVAMGYKQWTQQSKARASRAVMGEQPSAKPTESKKAGIQDEVRRREDQLDKIRGMLQRKLPVRRRIEILIELAASKDSPSVRLRALEMIHELEGLNAQMKNPAPPVRVPLFHIPVGAPRPAVASGTPTTSLDVGVVDPK